MEELNNIPTFKLFPQTKAIAIIADNSCIPCNQAFSNFLVKSLTNPDIQFVIAARADHLDLTPYINSSRKDIVYDANTYLIKNGIIKGSTMIFLTNSMQDTAITIETRQLETQLDYISQKLQ